MAQPVSQSQPANQKVNIPVTRPPQFKQPIYWWVCLVGGARTARKNCGETQAAAVEDEKFLAQWWVMDSHPVFMWRSYLIWRCSPPPLIRVWWLAEQLYEWWGSGAATTNSHSEWRKPWEYETHCSILQLIQMALNTHTYHLHTCTLRVDINEILRRTWQIYPVRYDS